MISIADTYSSEQWNIALDMLEAFYQATEALKKAINLQHNLHDIIAIFDNNQASPGANIPAELKCIPEMAQLVQQIVANTQLLESKIHGLRGEVDNLRTYKRMHEVEQAKLFSRCQSLLVQVNYLENSNRSYQEQCDKLNNMIAQCKHTCSTLQEKLNTTNNKNNIFLNIV